MEEKFFVSVIIPVYNAERFLIESVNSALRLEEVGEVILIEDRSPDNALELCKKFEADYKKVRLLTHPNNENRGAGASRNLGIKNARFEYIAFLDADDKYLPNRFIKDAIVFQNFKNADAVYSNAIAKNKEGVVTRKYSVEDDLRKEIGNNAEPREFYKKRLQIPHTIFCTNSITFKKKFLIENKLFDERLRLHQDSELWKRLMRKGNFFAGELKNPVAEIREHNLNRIINRNFNSELKSIAVFIDNVRIENLFDFEVDSLFKRGVRRKSEKFKNHWMRRASYYFNYLRYSNEKKKFLGKIKKEYKDLEI